MKLPTLSSEMMDAIVIGQHGDPFSVLGPHQIDDQWMVRAFLPGAETAVFDPTDRRFKSTYSMTRIHPDGLFEIAVSQTAAVNEILKEKLG